MRICASCSRFPGRMSTIEIDFQISNITFHTSQIFKYWFWFLSKIQILVGDCKWVSLSHSSLSKVSFFQLLIVIIRTLYEVDVEKQVIPILTLIPAEPLMPLSYLSDEIKVKILFLLWFWLSNVYQTNAMPHLSSQSEHFTILKMYLKVSRTR